jgi:hypothetical protein
MLGFRELTPRFLANNPDLREKTLGQVTIENDSAVLFGDPSFERERERDGHSPTVRILNPKLVKRRKDSVLPRGKSRTPNCESKGDGHSYSKGSGLTTPCCNEEAQHQ